MPIWTALEADLRRDEGTKLRPYMDSVGKMTVGVGRNLDDVGITKEEAQMLLENDVRRVIGELGRGKPRWRQHPEPVQQALANMCFNMGWPRLRRFKRMWAALDIPDYELAADEALDSKWARQVGQRATRIAGLIREGGH